MLKSFAGSDVATAFHQAYYSQLLREVLAVLTDTFHTPGFKLHCKILLHLFGLVRNDAVIKAPLWDVAVRRRDAMHCGARGATWVGPGGAAVAGGVAPRRAVATPVCQNKLAQTYSSTHLSTRTSIAHTRARALRRPRAPRPTPTMLRTWASTCAACWRPASPT